MGYNAHRGTPGHTIATGIMGKDSANSPKLPTASAGHGLKSIRAEFGANGGVSVTHSLQPTGKQDSFDPRLEQTHMFRDATEAHQHMGALMGTTALRVGSGEQKD